MAVSYRQWTLRTNREVYVRVVGVVRKRSRHVRRCVIEVVAGRGKSRTRAARYAQVDVPVAGLGFGV